MVEQASDNGVINEGRTGPEAGSLQSVSDSVLPPTIPHHHVSCQARSVHEAKQTYPSLPGYASNPSEVPKPRRIRMLMTSPTIKLCETNSMHLLKPPSHL